MREVVYTAHSKLSFYARDIICEHAFGQGVTPLNPFRMFGYFLSDRVDRSLQGVFEQVATVSQTPEELAQLMRDLYETCNRPARPPASGGEFRRRALEHRQNRGTGPARRDNRRWRNP